MDNKERFLSGMRPTGFIHLKHLMVIDEWLKLEQKYECFFGIYNSLAMTTAKVDTLVPDTLTVFKAYLAGGLNYDQSIIFAQSMVPEHSQMFQLLLQATPQRLLERAIVHKRKSHDRERINMGILSYPVQELADALIFNAPYVTSSIPGNVEMTHKIIRSLCAFLNLDPGQFNFPKVIVPPIPSIPGFDGKRTSSQRQNFICPTDDLELIRKKVARMPTDNKRKNASYPGNPDNCCVYAYYVLPKIQDTKDKEKILKRCQAGTIGCQECKGLLTEALWQYFATYRLRQMSFDLDDRQLREMLRYSSARASLAARATLRKYQDIFKMSI